MKKALILLVLFIIPTILFLDIPVGRWAISHKGSDFYVWCGEFSNLAISTWYLVVSALLWLYFKYINKIALYSSRVGFFFLSIVVSGIVTNIIKVVLGKARPKILEYDDFYGLTWFNLDHAYQSFPSGHTTTAFAIFASLSIMFPKYIWVFLFYALAIAFARIGFFAHYPSDVMAGAIVGIGATLILQKKYFKELVAFDK